MAKQRFYVSRAYDAGITNGYLVKDRVTGGTLARFLVAYAGMRDTVRDLAFKARDSIAAAYAPTD